MPLQWETLFCHDSNMYCVLGTEHHIIVTLTMTQCIRMIGLVLQVRKARHRARLRDLLDVVSIVRTRRAKAMPTSMDYAYRVIVHTVNLREWKRLSI
jgi:hypothetical protein